MNPDMDAVYFLSPLPHIVDCLLADFERRRYRRGFIIWAGTLPDQLERRLDGARRQMGGTALRFSVFWGCWAHDISIGPPDRLLVDFFPRESHLITFQDPSSFLVLYNPTCNNLVAPHLRTLASKVRPYRPARYGGSVLLANEAFRSPLSALPCKKSPKSGTFNPLHTPPTRQKSCACTWLASSRRS